ncbi:hypothetical protein KAW55_06720 [bacterium]|nr:hypothetical protein [bacterium]
MIKLGIISAATYAATYADKVTFPPPIHGMRPKFENDLECGQCGKLTIDEVELTELGQTQMTGLFFKSEGLTKGGRKKKKRKK